MYLNNAGEEKENLLESKQRQEPFDKYDVERTSVIKSERPTQIPRFILSKMTVYEKSSCLKYLCFCFNSCVNKKYFVSNINLKDLEAYHRLRNLAIQYYDENNSSHEESLKNLFMICLKNEITVDLTSSEWKEIGFQSENPRTDFRGSGYISLLFIIYFIKQNQADYLEMLQFEYFLFAVVAIRLVFYFKIALHLIDDGEDQSEHEADSLVKLHKLRYVSVPQFKNFIKRQNENPNYSNEVLSDCLNNIKEEYKNQYVKEKKELNFLIIEPIIYSCFINTFYTKLE